MDPDLLRYYNQELHVMRELGGEFASTYPKIAGRLGLSSFECADPYVERLLEGFAFLAARIQMKMDQEFPAFTENLLEIIYPHYLAPTPSMAVVQFEPDTGLQDRYVIPKGTSLRGLLGADDRTACEYTTGTDVSLWPLRLADASYIASPAPLTSRDVGEMHGVRAGLCLIFETSKDIALDDLGIETLPLFLRGDGGLATRLYEQLLASATAVVLRCEDKTVARLEAKSIRRMGMRDEEALLPQAAPSFSGYRLLQEYFAFPQRFLFVELTGLEALKPAVRGKKTTRFEVIVLLNRSDGPLAGSLSTESLALFAAPAINLFPKRMDRIDISEHTPEFHVIPDRTRPMDFEVHHLTSVQGIASGHDEIQPFAPFYNVHHHERTSGYYAIRRARRVLSSKQRQQGPRTSYVGSETYISLVDQDQAPYRHDLRQLSLTGYCTNRDLPLMMPIGTGASDFTLEIGAPVTAIACLAGPSPPLPALARGRTAWRVISHLSLNYLSLQDVDENQGAAGLRNLLRLYGVSMAENTIERQIEGIVRVATQPITRRLPQYKTAAFGQGLEITLVLDETAFEGEGAFLIGSILERFFARWVSINAFTETVIRTIERGEIKRWPAQPGRRHNL
ncbi:MAG: type VI secretion system baseplate subunit TssF [Pseudomonadota bacterium]